MDIVRIYIYIYTRAISFPRAGDRLLLVRFHDRWFIFRLDGNRGRGINVASTFSPRRASRRRFFVFLKRRVVSFFFFCPRMGDLLRG